MSVGRALLGTSLLVACGSSNAPAPGPGRVASDELAAGVIARVAAESIETKLVERLAAAQEVRPRAALDGLVADALLATELRSSERTRALYLERIALSRHLLESFGEQAAAQGPPTDEEVEEFTRRHWWQLDRPAAARVVHAVVVCQEDCPDRAGARALAGEIAAATATAGDASTFIEAAKSVSSTGFDLRVEKLEPVTADGRIVSLNARPNSDFSFGSYHSAFARAATALQHVGERSGIVESPSGFHVMLLVEQLPEHRLSHGERATMLHDEIIAARAGALQEAALAASRERTEIRVVRSFESDTELLLQGP